MLLSFYVGKPVEVYLHHSNRITYASSLDIASSGNLAVAHQSASPLRCQRGVGMERRDWSMTMLATNAVLGIVIQPQGSCE